jgi:benzoyl-CoA reductase subunit A
VKVFVGIDLGSTTTKSVVLDDAGSVLGHGITNSRSNYEVACSIAKSEAFDSVRLSLCARELRMTGVPEPLHAPLLAAFESAFRLTQHRSQLRALGEEMLREADDVSRYFGGAPLAPAIRQATDEMDEDAARLFAPGAPRRSDFFRDTATSEWHRLAQRLASPGGVPFEAFMAVFDKAILKIENRQVAASFEDAAGDAADRALTGLGIGRDSAASVRRAIERAFRLPLDVASSVGTGYGRATLPFPKEQIRSEILCHGLGAHALFPRTATVLDIGGQDTKAIQVDGNGIVTSFQMNDRCAAGCGRYLGYIADEMNLGLHELGPLAARSTRPVRINSTCTVFAGAEIRDRLTLGQKREDILAGLHRAVILRAMSLLARSGGVRNEFTFTGGVAKNTTAVAVLRDLVRHNFGEVTLNISPDSIYTGALGAALFALRGTPAEAAA